MFRKGHPIRRGNDDFVARLKHRERRAEQRLFRARREADFLDGISRAGLVRHFLRQPLAQGGDAERVGILCFIGIECLADGVLDGGTGVLIQFARREVDDADAGLAQFAGTVSHARSGRAAHVFQTVRDHIGRVTGNYLLCIWGFLSCGWRRGYSLETPCKSLVTIAALKINE